MPSRPGLPLHDPRRRGAVRLVVLVALACALALAVELVPRGSPHAAGRAPRVERGGWPLGLELEIAGETALVAPTEEAVRLGERLFFDADLSRDRTVSCASCHDPARAFAGKERFSAGVEGRVGTRNAPAIANRLMGRMQFWDGRAADLVAQVRGPMMAPLEMDMDEELLLERLGKSEYGEAFQRAFGAPPSLELASRAIAAFESTLVTGDAPFDRHEWLGQLDALSESARRGLALFRGAGRCTLCHTGTNFTDELFHDVGLAGTGDLGRRAVTGSEADHKAFKTPSLRNVALTAPYMHDGSLATLEDVLEHYVRGGAEPGSELVPLTLDETQKGDLIAFLESLTGPVRSVRVEDLEAKLAELR
jgi:cytochrome c peroxidase